jgi:hypothetical protein
MKTVKSIVLGLLSFIYHAIVTSTLIVTTIAVSVLGSLMVNDYLNKETFFVHGFNMCAGAIKVRGDDSCVEGVLADREALLTATPTWVKTLMIGVRNEELLPLAPMDKELADAKAEYKASTEALARRLEAEQVARNEARFHARMAQIEAKKQKNEIATNEGSYVRCKLANGWARIFNDTNHVVDCK